MAGPVADRRRPQYGAAADARNAAGGRRRGPAKRVARMHPELDAARLRAIAAAFSGKRILVVGDLMLDEFIWGKVSRISPEAPVPVVNVVSESYYPGGAANVARNVREFTAGVAHASG